MTIKTEEPSLLQLDGENDLYLQTPLTIKVKP